MNDYNDKIKSINELTMTLKQAFQPMPPGAGGAPPPMDPAMMQQGAPPMDPAMMQQQGMDPAAMQQGAPPPTDPAQIEAMLSEVMSAVEQMAGALEQQGQASAQLQQQLQQIMSEHAQVAGRLDMMEKAIKDSTSPLEGVGVENM
jgi:uncharacterized protein YukE